MNYEPHSTAGQTKTICKSLTHLSCLLPLGLLLQTRTKFRPLLGPWFFCLISGLNKASEHWGSHSSCKHSTAHPVSGPRPGFCAPLPRKLCLHRLSLEGISSQDKLRLTPGAFSSVHLLLCFWKGVCFTFSSALAWSLVHTFIIELSLFTSLALPCYVPESCKKKKKKTVILITKMHVY